MHLLSINEIFEEIKKINEFIKTLKITGYPERNTLKSAIDTINKLSKLYFSKSAK